MTDKTRDEKVREIIEDLYTKAKKGFSLPAGLDDIIKLKKLTINQTLFQLNELYKIDEEKLQEVIVRHIASKMKPPLTFDDQGYKILGNLAPEGIKDLAHAIAQKLNENPT